MSDEPSLRERKKRATRLALGEAAMKLALIHGPENVRVEEIAAAAGVSPRTYNNYFPSREAAICAVIVERNRQLGDQLRARPRGEPLAEACVNAVLEHHVAAGEPDRRVMEMVFRTPALLSELMKNVGNVHSPLIEAVADRTGHDPQRDMFPAVLAGGLMHATRIATHHWLDVEPDRPFLQVLRDALALVAPIASQYETR